MRVEEKDWIYDTEKGTRSCKICGKGLKHCVGKILIRHLNTHQKGGGNMTARKNWQLSDIRIIYDAIQNGLSHREIAQKLGRTLGAIRYMTIVIRRVQELNNPADVESFLIGNKRGRRIVPIMVQLWQEVRNGQPSPVANMEPVTGQPSVEESLAKVDRLFEALKEEIANLVSASVEIGVAEYKAKLEAELKEVQQQKKESSLGGMLRSRMNFRKPEN